MSLATPSPFPLDGRDITRVSRNEILAAIESAPKINGPLGGAVAARISSSVLVKFGRHVTLAEARTMRLVSSRTTVRLPAVIDAWEADDKIAEGFKNTGYIVMEYVKGIKVADMWHNLGVEDRSSILRQLHEYTCQLQSVEMDLPGPIGGGVSEGSFFTDYGAGPFRSRKEIEDWFNSRLRVCHGFGHATAVPAGWFTGKFDILVICHLDIHAHNLLVDDQGKLWLLDWGFAGAYPPYFERANLKWGSGDGFKRDFLEMIEDTKYQEEVDNLIAIGFSLTTGAQSQV